MAQKPLIDLHIHSNYSDGLWTPDRIVATARLMGLKAVAITDHDDIRNLPAALKAGKENDVEIVPGIEISAIQGEVETHILGYYIDPENEELLEFTRQFRRHRENRALQILHKLDGLGIHIPFDLLKSKAGLSSLGRPHIADLLVEEGVVFSYNEAFQKWIGDNRPAYIAKKNVTAQRAIQLIHNAGGLAFLAHPGTGVDLDTIQELIRLGLDGIETLHPKHLPMMTEMYQEIVRKNGLLETGGSDCHGGRRGEIMLGIIPIPYHLLEAIKDKRLQTRKTLSVG